MFHLLVEYEITFTLANKIDVRQNKSSFLVLTIIKGVTITHSKYVRFLSALFCLLRYVETFQVTGVVEGSSVVGDVLGCEVVGLRVPMIGACDGLVEGAREGAGIPQLKPKIL